MYEADRGFARDCIPLLYFLDNATAVKGALPAAVLQGEPKIPTVSNVTPLERAPQDREMMLAARDTAAAPSRKKRDLGDERVTDRHSS